MKKERLLLIDALRIVGIILIILHHLSETRFSYGDYQRFTTFLLFPTYYINFGTIGILVFIFASGCSLAASGKSPTSISEVKDFYKNRLLRIYPVYWVAVFFSIFLRASIIPTLTASDFLRTFFGFQEFFASSWIDEWGKINGTFWFIGVILSLYLLYPLVSAAIRKHPHVSLLSALVVEITSRMLFWYSFPQIIDGWSWFPLCRIFEFCFGIYVIRTGLYPRMNSNTVIAFLGKLSFYLFLVFLPIMEVANNTSWRMPLFISTTLIFAYVLYSFDEAIHRISKKH